MNMKKEKTYLCLLIVFVAVLAAFAIIKIRLNPGKAQIQEMEQLCQEVLPYIFLSEQKSSSAQASPFFYQGVVARYKKQRSGLEKFTSGTFLRRFDHFFFGCAGSAEADIGANGIVEQVHILEYHGDIGQQAVAGRELIADGFLQSCPEVIEQKPEKYQNDLNHDDLPDPGRIEWRPILTTLDQKSYRVGCQNQRSCRKNMREKCHDEAVIQFSSEFTAPVDDALYCSKHGLHLLCCGGYRPVSCTDMRLPHVMVQRAGSKQFFVLSLGCHCAVS